MIRNSSHCSAPVGGNRRKAGMAWRTPANRSLRSARGNVRLGIVDDCVRSWWLRTGDREDSRWRVTGSNAFLLLYKREKQVPMCLPPTLKALPSAAVLHNAISSSFSFLCSRPPLSLLFCLRPRSSLQALCTVRDVWQASSCRHHLVDSCRGPVRFQSCRYQRRSLH